ncbi:MAG: VCBS repeat-containing protein, partial [Candidatus Neomarinimicrobiota bacterium]
KKYALTVNTEGEGSVTEKVIKAGVATDYNSGTVVELTAVPEGEWLFVEWTGDLTGSENPKEITIDKAKTVTAVFVKKQYPLTIEIEGEGTVSEKVIKQGLATDYNSGTIVELTAEPTGDWEFVEWTGDITSTENPVQITIDGPKTVKVKFVREYNYLTSWDIIKHYNESIIKFSDLGYDPYQYCGYDTTTAAGDYNKDGYIDFLIAPQCHDDQINRQPPIKIYLNDKNGNFYQSDIEIENNIGTLSGTRTTIVGDYNGDSISDVFFVSHDGHDGPLGSHAGGFPSILLSDGSKFVYKDINLPRCWLNDASSADIDLDGDLDIIYGGGCYGLLENDGNGNFTHTKNFILNYDNRGIGVVNLMDMNDDEYPDLIWRTAIQQFIILSNNGIFDFNNSIEIPAPGTPGKDQDDDPNKDGIQMLDVNDRVVFDIDNDGDYDIITASIPHNPNNLPDLGGGYYYNIMINNNLEFTDVTQTYFDEPFEPRYVEWLRINDFDKDGYLELYENQKNDNWWARRWNGSKFEKLN